MRPAASGTGLDPVQDAHVAFVKDTLLRTKPFSGTGPFPFWSIDGQYDTHKHQANGLYVLDSGTISQKYPSGTNLDPVPGKWLLSAQVPGATPVVQRVTLKASKGVLRATAGWDDHPADKGQPAKARTAATVDMAYFAKGADKTIQAEYTLITAVTLPRKEIIFLCGVDYKIANASAPAFPYDPPENAYKEQAGTRFEIFAQSHRLDLLAAKEIDKGTRVTFLNARTGIRSTTVLANSGWLTIDLERTGTSMKDPDSISILDLYAYLDSVGANAPSTVQEVGVFSHAWVGGPILRDTYDNSGSATTRDPDDRDARPKDWNGTGVMASYPRLKAAFSSNASFKTWGCNQPVLIRAQILAARSRLKARNPVFPRNRAFTAESSYDADNGQTIHEIEAASLDQLRFVIGQYFNAPTGARTYLGAAVHFLTIPCFGAPIGAGANYINNRMVLTAPEGDPVLDYLKLEFSLPASSTSGRYMDYQALKSVTVASPPFSPDRWYGHWPVTQNFAGANGSWGYVKLHNGVLVRRPSSLGVTVSWLDPPIVAGSPGVLFRFSKTTPDKICRLVSTEALLVKQDAQVDSGVFVQQNGNVWVVQKQLPGGAWKVVTTSIPRQHLNSAGGGVWTLVANLPPVTDGLLAGSASGVF
jgi:hypothetical protein